MILISLVCASSISARINKITRTTETKSKLKLIGLRSVINKTKKIKANNPTSNKVFFLFVFRWLRNCSAKKRPIKMKTRGLIKLEK